MPSPNGLAPLDYAPPARRLPWRTILLWSLVAVAILASFVICHVAIRQWRRFHVLNLERNCIDHPIAEGILVFSSANPAATVLSQDAVNLEKATSNSFDPSQLPQATAFAGELRAPNGRRGFVDVEARASLSGTQAYTIEFSISCFNDAGIETRGGTTRISGEIHDPNHPVILIYSAVKDAADPAHIQFRFGNSDDIEQVDIRLGSDGSLPSAFRPVGP